MTLYLPMFSLFSWACAGKLPREWSTWPIRKSYTETLLQETACMFRRGRNVAIYYDTCEAIYSMTDTLFLLHHAVVNYTHSFFSCGRYFALSKVIHNSARTTQYIIILSSINIHAHEPVYMQLVIHSRKRNVVVTRGLLF